MILCDDNSRVWSNIQKFHVFCLHEINATNWIALGATSMPEKDVRGKIPHQCIAMAG
jgi:hypothetical protein